MGNQTQFSLRMIFGTIALVAIEIWLLQQGPGWIVLFPVFIAIGLELAGYRSAARVVAFITLLVWLGIPCILGILAFG